MSEKQSKLREQAEVAFAKTQVADRAKSRVIEEIDLITQERNEKTLKLKTARMAKEARDHAGTARTGSPQNSSKT